LAGTVTHSTSTAGLLARVLVAFALTYVLGYERELRGSPAGDRTFSLIGTASAVLGNLAGAGLLAVAALATGLVLVALEGPHRDDDTAVLPDATPSAGPDRPTPPTSDEVSPASAAYRRPD
jgi:uncharacterized membrane protein YhiD involved in acid resistance